MKKGKAQSLLHGASLIELAFVLALTSFCSFFLLSNYFAVVRASALNTSQLDALLKQQQLTYFFRQMLSSAGQYNIYDSRNKQINSAEQERIVNHPVVLPNYYSRKPELGAKDGKSDTLVVNLMSDIGCNGRRFNYTNGELFHLVNEVFIQEGVLKCRSYDGRFLSGLHNMSARWSSVSLLNGVQAMQVSYLVKSELSNQYLSAQQLTHLHAIAAIKLELWLLDEDMLLQKLNASLSVFRGKQKQLTPSSKQRRIMLLLPVHIGRNHD